MAKSIPIKSVPKHITKNYIKYDLVLSWNTSKRPFITQKISFKAPAQFNLAFKEAKKIKRLLWSVGDLKKSNLKILSLSASGVLEEYQKEHAPYLIKQQKDLNKRVKKVIAGASDAKPAAKAAIKKQKFKMEKDHDFKFTINSGEKPMKKSKVKFKVQKPLKYMYDIKKS